SIVVSAVDAQQQVLLPARRVSLAEVESWAATHVLATDAVVLEASTNAWQFYDLLEPLVASVTVAHPFLIKLLAQARVKTDGRDALHLAKHGAEWGSVMASTVMAVALCTGLIAIGLWAGIIWVQEQDLGRRDHRVDCARLGSRLLMDGAEDIGSS